MAGVGGDTDGAEVGVADGDAGGLFVRGGLGGLVDGEDTHYGAARAGDDTVGEVTVGGDDDMAREFADGDLVGGFLKFDDLLVNEVGFFMEDEVGVEGALFACVLAGYPAATTSPW